MTDKLTDRHTDKLTDNPAKPIISINQRIQFSSQSLFFFSSQIHFSSQRQHQSSITLFNHAKPSQKCASQANQRPDKADEPRESEDSIKCDYTEGEDIFLS
jgi:hypothetical protein